MEWFWLTLAVILSIPAGVLALELLLAQLRPRQIDSPTPRLACVVLIPAHNEQDGIVRTLDSLRVQLIPGDRVVVIADNCTDATAEVSRTAGVEVVERFDMDRRGKGYALDAGLRYVTSDAPAIVVMVDADCVVQPGAIDALTKQVQATQAPAQAVYRMVVPATATSRQRVSAFAMRVKNELRPRGLQQLGATCLLTGSGMAFPWQAIHNVNLATGNIVEDMQLGIDLALNGQTPRLCPQAIVEGDIPPTTQAENSQRRRWVHGHLHTMLTQAPRLLFTGLSRGRLSLILLAFELSVPPLTLFLLVGLLGLAGLAAISTIGGVWAFPAYLLGTAMAALLLSLGFAWLRFGRADLPARSLVGLPVYFLWKTTIALAYWVAPQRKWVRTDRGNVTVAHKVD